jgi:hypothetical protein
MNSNFPFRDSSLNVVTRLRVGRRKNYDSIPDRDKNLFFFSVAPRPGLRPTQPPIQWVSGLITRG